MNMQRKHVVIYCKKGFLLFLKSVESRLMEWDENVRWQLRHEVFQQLEPESLLYRRTR